VTAQPLPTTTTRADVLRHAERLRRAALLLEAHARRCLDPDAPAHALALRQARGMVRRLTSEEERWRHE
jgi:hypothetical protein